MRKALLDEHGILVGFTDDGRKKGVEVPDNCDLIPFNYRYDNDMSCFMPIEKKQETQLQMTAEAALFSLINHLEAGGDPSDIPHNVKVWAAQFKRTMDAKESIDVTE